MLTHIIFRDFEYLLRGLRALFADKILRRGEPWTPAVRGKWCRKLARELPERPDWRALAAEIERLEEERS